MVTCMVGLWHESGSMTTMVYRILLLYIQQIMNPLGLFVFVGIQFRFLREVLKFKFEIPVEN
jgi:hypothetical protein